MWQCIVSYKLGCFIFCFQLALSGLVRISSYLKGKGKTISRNCYNKARKTPTNSLFLRHTMKPDTSKLLSTIDFIFDLARASF